MLFARMIAPVHSLGPGNRIGIWIQGCSKNCKGCISGELQAFDKTKEVPVEILVDIIKTEAERQDCDRLTISGGDPFEQAEDLYVLLKGLRPYFKDILVYTGFTFKEVSTSEIMRKCLEFIDVLIDGRYIEEENFGENSLYGSNNQKINILNQDYNSEYMQYNNEKHNIEAFIHNKKVVLVGIQERR